jgi:hypothetical protein
MLHVFADRPSRTARLLARQLGGRRAKTLRRVKSGDVLVNWGCKHLTGLLAERKPLEIKVLQQWITGTKYKELELLADAGLRVPAFARIPSEGWLGRKEHHMFSLALFATPRIL